MDEEEDGKEDAEDDMSMRSNARCVMYRVSAVCDDVKGSQQRDAMRYE